MQHGLRTETNTEEQRRTQEAQSIKAITEQGSTRLQPGHKKRVPKTGRRNTISPIDQDYNRGQFAVWA